MDCNRKVMSYKYLHLVTYLKNQSYNKSISSVFYVATNKINIQWSSLTLYCQARIEKKKKKDRSSFKQCKVAADPGQVAHPVNILPHCFTLFFAKFKLPETTNLWKRVVTSLYMW